ncbi:MAG: hypothetical protein IBX55_01175 [Methyloprofundus sp.]|nr:hypothetical protein [Methyloprofundus sp.]
MLNSLFKVADNLFYKNTKGMNTGIALSLGAAAVMGPAVYPFVAFGASFFVLGKTIYSDYRENSQSPAISLYRKKELLKERQKLRNEKTEDTPLERSRFKFTTLSGKAFPDTGCQSLGGNREPKALMKDQGSTSDKDTDIKSCPGLDYLPDADLSNQSNQTN